MKDKFVLFLILVAVVAMLPGCAFRDDTFIYAEAYEKAKELCSGFDGINWVHSEHNYVYVSGGGNQTVTAACNNGVKVEVTIKIKR